MPKPPHFPPRANPAVDGTLNQAMAALRAGRADEAERLAMSVLKANRGHAGAALVLAQALGTQNRLAEAVPVLQRIARASSDPKFETLLASALAAAGRVDDALAQLQQTIAHRPPFPPAFAEYANLQHRNGETAKAIATIEHALTLAPNEIPLMQQLATLLQGTNARSRAREILQRAVTMAPGRPDLIAALARLCLLDGDYPSALDLFRRALGLQPADAMTRTDLAVCLFEMGDREAGEAALRRALRDQPALLGRATHVLAGTPHGRFFLRPSAAAAFLNRGP